MRRVSQLHAGLRNGYRSQRRSGGIGFKLAARFQPISTSDSLYFPIGVIRLSSFEDNIFPDHCERAANRLNITQDSMCDADCEGALDRETGNEMAEALARQVAALTAAGIDRLIVDITADGGGTNWADCCTLYYPSRYTFKESAFKGSLIVLVDNNTASAAEYFAAMLVDNNAAIVVGAPTNGSGCGYTNGGIPVRLAFSGATVKMPDCVRYRADGTNEVEGVTPSVLIPWRANDSPLQRARRAVAVLAGLKPR